MTFFLIVLHIVLIACLVLISVYFFASRRRKAGWSKSLHDLEGMKRQLTTALREIGSDAHWSKEGDELWCSFVYQGHTFYMHVRENIPNVEIIFRAMMTAEPALLDVIRVLCNSCNLYSRHCKMIYTMDEKQGLISIHAETCVFIFAESMPAALQRSLNELFECKKVVLEQYAALKAERATGLTEDIEYSDVAKMRDRCLQNELEMSHQETGPNWHENEGYQVTLRKLLDTCLGIKDITPVGLGVMFDFAHQVFDKPEDILDYPVSNLLIDGNLFVRDSATATLTYVDPRCPRTRRQLVIVAQRREQTEHTLYYHITCMVVPVNYVVNFKHKVQDLRKQVCTVLIGYDLDLDAEYHQQFIYQWKELVAKAKEGDLSQLSAEEQMLYRLANPDYGQMFYCARELYEKKRFCESVTFLEHLYEDLSCQDLYSDAHLTNVVCHICYLIGACYTFLRQYDRALYYLQLSIPVSKLLYARAYLNCLILAHDPRAMAFIDDSPYDLDNLEEVEENGEYRALTDREKDFVRFLKRRKAYLLVDMKRLDEAENILTSLLDDMESSDYALHELAYIQRMRD